MRAVKLPARVDKDHTLRLQLPEEIREGPAEVIVLVAEPSADGTSQPEEVSIKDFLARPRVDRQFIRSKDEIDDYLRVERESWESDDLRGPIDGHFVSSTPSSKANDHISTLLSHIWCSAEA